jgi:hypothetical protein
MTNEAGKVCAGCGEAIPEMAQCVTRFKEDGAMLHFCQWYCVGFHDGRKSLASAPSAPQPSYMHVLPSPAVVGPCPDCVSEHGRIKPDCRACKGTGLCPASQEEPTQANSTGLIAQWRAIAKETRAAADALADAPTRDLAVHKTVVARHFRAATLETCARQLEALSSSAPATWITPAGRALRTRAANLRARNHPGDTAKADFLEEIAADLGASSAPVERPRACVIGKYCHRHGFIHGGEAEELRSKVEKILGRVRGEGRLSRVLRDMLDEVDARDSLALLEAQTSPETPAKETR